MEREQEQKILQLYKQGKKYREICTELNVTMANITKVVRKAKCHRGKMIHAIENGIIEMYKKRFSLKEITEKYGITPGTIYHVLDRNNLKRRFK